MTKLISVIAGAVGCVTRPSPTSEATTSTVPSAVPERRPTESGSYSIEARRTLLRIARAALERAVREGKHMDSPTDIPADLLKKKGNFVTLTIGGNLRGCIGNIYPDLPLAVAVATNAYRAALNDPRFEPVTADALASIEIEVSVLSEPSPLAFGSPTELLEKLRPHVDGVVLKRGMQRATFLPQVWEKLPTAVEFLDHLSAKAGLRRDAWRESGTEILIYHVEAFTESEFTHDKHE